MVSASTRQVLSAFLLYFPPKYCSRSSLLRWFYGILWSRFFFPRVLYKMSLWCLCKDFCLLSNIFTCWAFAFRCFSFSVDVGMCCLMCFLVSARFRFSLTDFFFIKRRHISSNFMYFASSSHFPLWWAIGISTSLLCPVMAEAVALQEVFFYHALYAALILDFGIENLCPFVVSLVIRSLLDTVLTIPSRWSLVVFGNLAVFQILLILIFVLLLWIYVYISFSTLYFFSLSFWQGGDLHVCWHTDSGFFVGLLTHQGSRASARHPGWPG